MKLVHQNETCFNGDRFDYYLNFLYLHFLLLLPFYVPRIENEGNEGMNFSINLKCSVRYVRLH